MKNYNTLLTLVLVRLNIVNNDYQHNSNVLCTFVPNKSFCQSSLIQSFHVLKYCLLIKILNR